MSDIVPPNTPLKQCTGPCGQFLPATNEYFHSNGKTRLRPYCKDCRNEQKRAINATPEGKAKQQASNKAWSEIHKEEKTAYIKSYQEANKESLSKYYREYHQANREHDLEKNKRYNRTHREDRIAKQKAYARANPMQIRLTQQKMRVKRKSVSGTLTIEQVQAKLKDQKYACYYCFSKFEKKDGKYVFQLDHTIPVSRIEAGPRHDVNYIVLACPFCNNSKKARLPHEWPEGGRLF